MIVDYFGEIWKDIIGYEGLYQVSNYGRVKSLNYHRTGKEKLLKAVKKSDEHLYVDLWKNGIRKHCFVHRLVAEAFIPNPENKSIVHHIDNNPQNNNVDNLVWLTHEEHAAEHPEFFKAGNEAIRKAGSKATIKAYSKPINQFTLDGLFLRVWPSAMEIQRELGCCQRSIHYCCKGRKYHYGKWYNITQAYGYKWEYA